METTATPGGGGSASGNYVLRFEVGGAGKRELTEIAKILRGVKEDLAEGTGPSGGPGGGGLRGIADLFGGAKAGIANVVTAAFTAVQVIQSYVHMLGQFGRSLISISMIGFRMIAGIPGFILKNLSSIEMGFLRIKAISKGNEEQARAAMEAAQELVKFTPFQEHQVMGLATALRMGKIDLKAFTDEQGRAVTIGSLHAKGLTQVGEGALRMAKDMAVTPMSVLADLAAAFGQTGEQMDFFVRGVERALATGSVRLLTDQISPTVLKEIFGTTGQMKISAQEAIQNMYQYLLRENQIGSAAMASATFTGIMSNIKEIPMLIARAIGGDPSDPNSLYSQLRNNLADAFSSISAVLNSTEWQAGVKEGLTPIVEFASKGMQVMSRLVTLLMKFVGEHPTLLKFGTAVLIVGSALLGITGVILTVTAALASAGLAVTVLGVGFATLVGLTVMLTPLLVTMVPFLAIMAAIWGPITAGILGTAAAVGYAIFQTRNLSQVFEGLKALVTAVVEAIRNWGGDTTRISQETAEALDNAGLLDFFLRVTQFIRKGQAVLEHFSYVGEAFMLRLSGPAERLVDAVKVLVSMFTNAMEASGWFPERGRDASMLEGSIVGVLNVVDMLIMAFIQTSAWIVTALAAGINFGITVAAYISLISVHIQMLGSIIGAALLDPLERVYIVFQQILEAVIALVNADFSKAFAAISAIADKVAAVGKDRRGEMEDLEFKKGGALVAIEEARLRPIRAKEQGLTDAETFAAKMRADRPPEEYIPEYLRMMMSRPEVAPKQDNRPIQGRVTIEMDGEKLYDKMQEIARRRDAQGMGGF